MSAERPAITVVLAGLADASVLETTLLHLRAQTVRERIEVIVAVRDAARFGALPVEMDALWACRVLEVPGAISGAEANAAGARAAAAPVVAFAEDHAFAAPDWAEAIIAAHEGPWGAVGPALLNGNPDTVVSWADFVMSYGAWMDPAPAGPKPFLLGHNCTYKRDVLLELGDELETMLDNETVLHYRLAAEGHGLFLEPRARILHINFSRWPVWLSAQFLSGRTYAAALREGWSTPHKIAYALAAPLIPFVRYLRCVRQIREPGRRDVVPASVYAALAVGVLWDGAGQLVGHVAGGGDAEERFVPYEFRRIDNITADDRRALEALTASMRGANA